MSKFTVMATWDDVPHLTEEDKKELWNSIPPYQRDARTKGIPQLGAGAIYPIAEDEILVEPFELPRYWPRCYGLDVGWNWTACVWAAWDQESDRVYYYSEHLRSGAEPAIHAAAIKARGDWIPGVVDPAARGRSQIDGQRLIDLYTDLGLFLAFADNSVEAGIMTTWERLSDGRLKVFNSLLNWRAQYRMYRRDEKGKIVKKDDHLMDASRYLNMSGLALAGLPPPSESDAFMASIDDRTRSFTTGY